GVAPFASLGHVKALYSEGVRGVINLCDEYRGPTEEYSNLGMKHLYLPTGKQYVQLVLRFVSDTHLLMRCSVACCSMVPLLFHSDDHYEPSFADLQKAVAFIEQHAQRNEKVSTAFHAFHDWCWRCIPSKAFHTLFLFANQVY